MIKALTFWFLLMTCSLNIGLSENSFKAKESFIWLFFKVGTVSIFRSVNFKFDAMSIGASEIVNIESMYSILDKDDFILLIELMNS